MATIEGLSPCSLLRNMACVSSTSLAPCLSLRLTIRSPISQPKLLHWKNKQLYHNHWILSAFKKNAAKATIDNMSDGENIDISSKNNKKTTRRGRKKSSKETKEEIIPLETTTELTVEQAEKIAETVNPPEEHQIVKFYMRYSDSSIIKLFESIAWRCNISHLKPDPTRYETLIHADAQRIEDLAKILEASRQILENARSQILEEKKATERDDQDQPIVIGPPLVICFGPAKASFIPYARPANRIFDRKIHEAMHELYWSPDRFFRAPGSAASSVAIQLARFDGRVEFMGKLGFDSLGMGLLYELNKKKVQTRCVKINDSAATAVSHMKLIADGHCLKAHCVRPCAEDRFLSSDVNLDILKEAKMLYFNSSALLDPTSKSTIMEVIKIMKSQGSLIFFDLNLPLLLWHSPEEAKSLLKESFAVSNFIEMTQQELDFLCGIEQNVMENEDVKFVHRSREEVKEIWHDGLEVLFVTNGTSTISYYTKDGDGIVTGTEDVPIKPSCCEMSASGDAVVAALMKKLVAEPHKAANKSFLVRSIEYAIQAGVIAQLMLVTDLINPNKWESDQDKEAVTTDEDMEEESYGERVGELVA